MEKLDVYPKIIQAEIYTRNESFDLKILETIKILQNKSATLKSGEL